MELGIIILLLLLVAYQFADKNKTKKASPQQKTNHTQQTATPNQDEEMTNDNFDYSLGYKQKWMFTYNEKDAFQKLKTVTDELGLYLFAKVRLYDLVEPKPEIEKWRTYQYKIQAKHVDFVICDKKLVARAVIELDDASHEEAARKERDVFVDKVLQNCGYKIYHVKSIDPEAIKNTLTTDLLT